MVAIQSIWAIYFFERTKNGGFVCRDKMIPPQFFFCPALGPGSRAAAGTRACFNFRRLAGLLGFFQRIRRTRPPPGGKVVGRHYLLAERRIPTSKHGEWTGGRFLCLVSVCLRAPDLVLFALACRRTKTCTPPRNVRLRQRVPLCKVIGCSGGERGAILRSLPIV